jgi:hypothetical protein
MIPVFSCQAPKSLKKRETPTTTRLLNLLKGGVFTPAKLVQLKKRAKEKPQKVSSSR